MIFGNFVQSKFEDPSFKDTYNKISFKEDIINSILEWMSDNSISNEMLEKQTNTHNLSKLFGGEEEITLSFLSELHVLGYRIPAKLG